MIPRRADLLLLFGLVLALSLLGASAVPMPAPVQNIPTLIKRSNQAYATPAPQSTTTNLTPDEVLQFYKPYEKYAAQQHPLSDDDNYDDEVKSIALKNILEAKDLAKDRWEASPVERRGDVPTVPLADMPYPTFPSQYISCDKCSANYSSLSSCMEASSVFENATSIFNNPWSYISVIKCACTDTFQAVYPQCLECFQLTDQCQYLGERYPDCIVSYDWSWLTDSISSPPGTDPVGTGAPAIVTNLRSICAFGSSLLGHAQSANYPDYNFTFTPSTVPGYDDVTTT